MKSIIVALDNQVQYEGGKIGYGSRDDWQYEIRLSAKSASLVEVGDVILYWDCGSMDWGTQSCRGVIYKPQTHQIIALTGSRDCGRSTFHPPHLGLEMKKTSRVGKRDDKKILEKVNTDIPSILTLRKEYWDRPISAIPFPYFEGLWENN